MSNYHTKGDWTASFEGSDPVGADWSMSAGRGIVHSVVYAV